MNDLKFAIRQLIKHKGSSALAVFILALGIGGTTAVYSVADKVLLHPLPGRDTDRLVSVQEVNLITKFSWWASPPLIQELAARTNLFESVTFCEQGGKMRTQFGGAKEDLVGTRVPAGFFTFFGWMPEAGRTFLDDEIDPASGNVVVISHHVWQRFFGGAPNTVGSTLELDGKPRVIVGIMPPNEYPSFSSGRFDVWIPSTFSSDTPATAWEPEGDPVWHVYARMRPGVPLETVQAFLDTLVAGWMENVTEPNQRWRFEASLTLRGFNDSELAKKLWTIQAMIGMLLLIACANVGNLLLSRALSRRGEFGLRMAMGVGRWRIARQMMAESLSLAAIAAGCGVFLAWGGILLLERFYLSGFADGYSIGMNWRVLGFTCVAAAGAGLLFGVAPAWFAAWVDIGRSLKETAQQHSGGLAQRLFHDGFVIVQVCLSVVLLAGAGMMVHGVVRLLSLDPGMNPKQLFEIAYDPNPVYKTPYDTGAAMARGLSKEEARRDAYRWKGELWMSWHKTMLARLNAIPGVEVAAAEDHIGGSSGYQVEGSSETMLLGNASISVREGDYFEAIGATLTAGRWLNQDDCAPGEQTVVINARMADDCWPGESPLGKRFRPLDDGHSSAAWLADRVVVGVVKNIEYYQRGRDPVPGYYAPFERMTYEKGLSGHFNVGAYLVRTRLNPVALRRSLAQAGSEMSPPVDEIWRFVSVDEELYQSTAPRRIMMWLTLTMGGLGLLISALGIYAVMSFAVARRTREVGIRMAVGAGREQVRNLFLKRGARLIANGLALGVVVAMTLTQYIGHLVYGATLFDPWAFGGVLLVLALVAGAACWIPARRAAHVDPMTALRME